MRKNGSKDTNFEYSKWKKVNADNCLQALNPDLAKEWHPTKNGTFTPSDVTPGSYKKVWWLCQNGHEWEAIVWKRNRGTGCPYCKGQKVNEENCLQAVNPALVKEWHPTKNSAITPRDITPGSGKKVWWLCQNGHEWEAQIAQRNIGYGCPYCNRNKAKSENSLQTVNPGLAKEWHPTRNGDLTPRHVTPGSLKNIWWRCNKGHEWEAIIWWRNRGSGCPYCKGRKVNSENCLQTVNPVLAKEWHPTKNGNLTPRDVAPVSRKKVWWRCQSGHEWEATIWSRNRGSICPYCKGKKVNAENCLQVVNPALAAEWHPTKNGNLTPRDVTPVSKVRVWWLCQKGHEWQTQTLQRNSGSGCPYCNRKKAKSKNCLQSVNPALAAEWHPTKNGTFTPRDVKPGSNKKVWWLCHEGHEWQAMICRRNRGNGCPYCKGKKAKAENCLQVVNPVLAAEWHPTRNGTLTPRDVKPGSCKKVWWVCQEGHEWEAIIWSRNRGSICPYCKGKKANADNCLQAVKPALAKEWHPTKNGTLTPMDVAPESKVKAWWFCQNGHEWKAQIFQRNVGKGCPYCNRIKTKSVNHLQTDNPALAKEWHPTKNGTLTPKDVTPGLFKKVWWLCQEGHEWEAYISNRNRGNGCPYCCGMKSSDEYCLQTVNPALAAEWHPTKNGTLTPRDVTPGSSKKVWWICQWGHEWEAIIWSRNRGSFCPYCKGKKVNSENCLQTVNPALAAEWHPTKNGTLTPMDVTSVSNKKVWWICQWGHEWEAGINNRKNGTGCPFCSGHKGKFEI